jgi:hypothetical protein
MLIPPDINNQNSQTFGTVPHRCKNQSSSDIPGESVTPCKGQERCSQHKAIKLETIISQLTNLLHHHPEYLQLDDRAAQSLLDDLQTVRYNISKTINATHFLAAAGPSHPRRTIQRYCAFGPTQTFSSIKHLSIKLLPSRRNFGGAAATSCPWLLWRNISRVAAGPACMP